VSCDLKFNVVKSCVGCVSYCKRSRIDLLLESRVLPWVEKLKYLGVVFTVTNRLIFDVTERVQKFIASVSSVLRYKRSGNEQIFATILISKCLPILFYGLDCCVLSAGVISTITKVWNMSFKWLFNLRKFDSTRLLFLSCNTMSMKFLLDKGVLFFFSSLNASMNPIIRKLLVYGLSNISNMYSKYDLPVFADVCTIRRRCYMRAYTTLDCVFFI
jgi:hypothetical protein